MQGNVCDFIFKLLYSACKIKYTFKTNWKRLIPRTRVYMVCFEFLRIVTSLKLETKFGFKMFWVLNYIYDIFLFLRKNQPVHLHNMYHCLPVCWRKFDGIHPNLSFRTVHAYYTVCRVANGSRHPVLVYCVTQRATYTFNIYTCSITQFIVV